MEGFQFRNDAGEELLRFPDARLKVGGGEQQDSRAEERDEDALAGPDQQDEQERVDGRRMVQERYRSGDASPRVMAVRDEADREEDERNGEGSRGWLVFGDEDRGTGDFRAEREDGGDQERQAAIGEHGERDEIDAPEPEAAEEDLLGREDGLETPVSEPAEGEGNFVIYGEGNVRALDQDFAGEHGRIPEVLEYRDVDLGILREVGVAGELKPGQQRQDGQRGRDPEFCDHWAGVLSSCSFAQTRRGFSSTAFVKAWRAAALLCSLR